MPTLDPDVLHHPAVVEEFNKRSADAQLRVADKITAFAGSKNFVYLHIALFAVWMLVLERSPWPTLTLAVSLEGTPRTQRHRMEGPPDSGVRAHRSGPLSSSSIASGSAR